MRTKIIPRLLGMVPVSWRRAVIGSGGNPSRIANAVHDLLNLLPVQQDTVFDCKGDLEGYRMRTDWRRFRGLVYGNWEPEVSAVVRSVLLEGMTAIDIGGHIGYYTLLLAKCVGKNGRVFSFEPFPANFELLDINIRLNRLDYVEAIPLGLFSRAAKLILTVPDSESNSGDASVIHNVGSRQIQVEAVTLDSYCGQKGIRPDFLKMDVEGAEYDVLLGAEKTVRACRPKMLIELHHFDGDLAANRVPDLLKEWEYEIDWIDRFDQTSHIMARAGDRNRQLDSGIGQR